MKDRASRTGKSRGISLIELGMVMVFISLALVPVVQMMGGPNSSSGAGSADRISGRKSREIVLANSLVERALSSDFRVFNCDNTFDPATSMPDGVTTQVATFPSGSRCMANTNYNQPMYYQWTVRNTDLTGSIMPVGNHYYQVVLNVWNEPSGGTPILTLPTSLFWNEAGMNNASNTTGIAIVQDTSGSMAAGQNGGSPDSHNVAGYGILSSPYLKYRYLDPAFPAYDPGVTLINNLYNNATLDIASAETSDNAGTPWDDRYPKPGVNGSPTNMDSRNCQSAANNHAFWDNNDNIFVKTTNALMANSRQICRAGEAGGKTWAEAMNDHMSRIEASRGSLLNFIVSMEDDPELYNNTKLAFVTFNGGVQNQVVPLESANGSHNYVQMRRKVSWMNRGGPGNIPANGTTNMYGGLQRGADILFADPNLNTRIIFLVGDGAPTVAPTSHNAFRTLSTQIGNGTYAGANGKTATIFTLGLLSDDPDLPDYLRDDIASRTPGGQFFFAQNMGDVGPIFDQIKYQIQRVILLNKSNRYNVNFDPS